MLQEHITWFGQLLTLPIIVAIDGDYNADGTVDAADYVVWRKTDSGNSQGYTDWRENFGDGSRSLGAATLADSTSSARLSLIRGPVQGFAML